MISLSAEGRSNTKLGAAAAGGGAAIVAVRRGQLVQGRERAQVKWQAGIWGAGKRRHLGYFAKEEEARRTYMYRRAAAERDDA